MNSLRARLTGFILVAVGLVWFATAFMVWREAHHELHELLDALPTAVRPDVGHGQNEVEEEIAEHMAKPVLVAFPLLALLTALAVTMALRPLKKLTDEVSVRAPEKLDPLAAEGAPAEVKPLIERLNHLFTAIGRALENERRFTADAAHELRTPLAALKAQAQVAQSAQDEAVRQHALAQIIVGCDLAARLTEQLLMLARLDARRDVTSRTVELDALGKRVLADLAGEAIAQGGTLEWVDGEPVTVAGDEMLLNVLLRNLVENALRHNPPGTHVAVSLSLPEGRPTLTVQDDGAGISGENAMDMVQRFRRGDGAGGEGSGLGLSIVERIAQLHGIEFHLQSGAGVVGTVASLRWRHRVAT